MRNFDDFLCILELVMEKESLLPFSGACTPGASYY